MCRLHQLLHGREHRPEPDVGHRLRDEEQHEGEGEQRPDARRTRSSAAPPGWSSAARCAVPRSRSARRRATVASLECCGWSSASSQSCWIPHGSASLVLTSDRFGFEPEITARLAQARARVWEVSISYSGRTYEEGKKIGWRDGVAALWHILTFNCFTSLEKSIKKPWAEVLKR